MISDQARRLASGELSVDDYLAHLDPDRREEADLRLLTAILEQDPRLSRRQLQVLVLAGRGCTAQETADRLGIRLDSAKRHRELACRKLGARNVTHALWLALRQRRSSSTLTRPE